MRIPRLRISIAAVLAVAVVAAGATTGARSAPARARRRSSRPRRSPARPRRSSSTSRSRSRVEDPAFRAARSRSAAPARPTRRTRRPPSSSISARSRRCSARRRRAPVPKSIELVVVGNTVYLNFPALAKQAGAPGKQWVKFDLTKLPKSKTGGVDPKAVGSVSPQQALGGSAVGSEGAQGRVGQLTGRTTTRRWTCARSLWSCPRRSRSPRARRSPRPGSSRPARRLGRPGRLRDAVRDLAQRQGAEELARRLDHAHAQHPRLQPQGQHHGAAGGPDRRRQQAAHRPAGQPAGRMMRRTASHWR